MVVTADGSTLVVAESYATRLTAFTIADDGSLGDRRVWAELGDATLGDPLFLAGLVAGLWLVLRPIPRDFATGSRGRYPSTGSVPDGL